MNIVVTGGAGYIGGVTVERLLEEGHNVYILSNSSDQKQINPKAYFIEGDIQDFESHIKPEYNIDVVVHLAGSVQIGESMKDPDMYWFNNTYKTHQMLIGMKKLNIKKIIFASTSSVYGNQDILPIRENNPKNPTNTYSMTKLATEMELESYTWAHNFSVVVFRIFNVAGAYKGYGWSRKTKIGIIQLIMQTLRKNEPFTIFGDTFSTSDGTNERDYIHILDIANAIILSLDALESGKYKVYNLGTGHPTSNLKLIDTIEYVTNKKVNVRIGDKRDGDPDILYASYEKAKKELGWEPTHSGIEEIVSSAYEYSLSINENEKD